MFQLYTPARTFEKQVSNKHLYFISTQHNILFVIY